MKLHLSVLRDFCKLILNINKKKQWCARKRIHYSYEGRYPSLGITVCHHSASLVMPNCDPRDGFFYPTLTLVMDYYIVTRWFCHAMCTSMISTIVTLRLDRWCYMLTCMYLYVFVYLGLACNSIAVMKMIYIWHLVISRYILIRYLSYICDMWHCVLFMCTKISNRPRYQAGAWNNTIYELRHKNI